MVAMHMVLRHVVLTIVGSLVGSNSPPVKKGAQISTFAWSMHAYNQVASQSLIDVDNYVGQGPTTLEALQCVLLVWYTRVSRHLNDKPYKLVAEESNQIKGLQVTRRAKQNEVPTDVSGGKKKPPLVIGTIRMGFGHHRIAYGVADYALDKARSNRDVYFHDILNINADESTLIDDAEALYSMASRVATEGIGMFEKVWGASTKSGGTNALRMQCHTAH